MTIYVLSFLMVSNVKYISFKKVELFRRHPFHTLVGLVLIFVVIAAAPDIMGFIAMVIYVSSGAISTFMYYRRPAPALTEKEGGRNPDPEAFQPVRLYRQDEARRALALLHCSGECREKFLLPILTLLFTDHGYNFTS